MALVPFRQVDVFTNERFKGNPVAVVLQAEGLSSVQMQQIANWTNLSETTFVLPATHDGADYRVRIFTPGAELPFAGHPTIGTAHALLEAGKIVPADGVLVQQCEAGLIRLSVDQDPGSARMIRFDLPPAAITALDDAQVDELESILGTPLRRDFKPCLIDVGARWIVAQLASGQAVLDNRADLQRLRSQHVLPRATGVTIFGPYAGEQGPRIEVRSYAPAQGIDEDPVCGSGNGCVAAFIRHTGQTSVFGHDYMAAQGSRLGRAGSVRLSISAQRIQVGGAALTCIEGQLSV